ncbi:hypothetical protein DPX16_21506 [Anabarilius grahami]|uniref:Uncharacterized protein n=1 Tax=Anabarilius grahami TaxID=495550 RepID=A0A3N0XUM3_ANAGA|nr:hypothetical protein DPX16_21506 [Anabarilius grahami]
MRWHWTLGGRSDPRPPPGGRRWFLRLRAAGSESPVPCSSPSWRTVAGSGPRRTAATPPLPPGRQPPHLVPGARHPGLRPTFHKAPVPPPRAASRGLHSRAARTPQHRDPPQQRGLSDSMSLLPPGFRHQCWELQAHISALLYWLIVTQKYGEVKRKRKMEKQEGSRQKWARMEQIRICESVKVSGGEQKLYFFLAAQMAPYAFESLSRRSSRNIKEESEEQLNCRRGGGGREAVAHTSRSQEHIIALMMFAEGGRERDVEREE